MKILVFLLLGFASLTSAVAQNKSDTNSNGQGRYVDGAMSSKPLMVSGRVSPDGKTLLTDIDSEWTISNPDALKGHEGLRVMVKCYVDTEKSRIQILRVKKEEDFKYAAKHDDSAFRR